MPPKVREEWARLIHLGYSDDEAREMAFAVEKSAEEETWARAVLAAEQDEADPVEKAAHYHGTFVEAARKLLPAWQFRAIHHHAHSATGGKRTAENKRARALADLAPVDGPPDLGLQKPDVEKQGPTRGEVHSMAPLTPGRRRRRRRDVTKRETSEAVPFGENHYFDAQRLVAGMDHEMALGGMSPARARTRASAGLAKHPDHYAHVFPQDWTPHGLPDVQLDLGSGRARAPGFLGVDVYPFDHGTMVHDLGLGLPYGLEPGACSAVRLVDALEQMDEFEDDATPLIEMVRQALRFGGRLLYEGRGDLLQLADFGQLPGLQLIQDESLDDEPGGRVRQVFERVPAAIPKVYGADPSALWVDEDDGQDAAWAREVMGAEADADTLMGNLALKAQKPDQRYHVIKADRWQQILVSVVYAPGEFDTDNEYMDPHDIEAAAHQALRDGDVFIASEHGGQKIGAHIVESYIVPAEFTVDGPYGKQVVPKGAWIVAIKFSDPREWQKVLDGTYQGLSVGGFARRDDGANIPVTELQVA